MKVFHHNDLDGRCSAAIVAFIDRAKDIEYIEINYGDPIPFERISPEEMVYVLDFSFQGAGDWERLRGITENILWIDHHETALSSAPDWLNKKPGLRSVDRCGAWLTWKYFSPAKIFPEALHLVDSWDRWTHKDNPDVIAFVNGMAIRDTNPRSPDWWSLLDGDVRILRAIQNEGVAIQLFRENEDREDVRNNAYLVEWEGYNCLVLHKNKGGSKTFDSVPIADRPEVFLLARYNGRLWTVSLYSDHVKVNDIAKKYGGGGHPGAAGFQCDKLPWMKE